MPNQTRRRSFAAAAVAALLLGTLSVLGFTAPVGAAEGDIPAACVGSTPADKDLLRTLAQLGGNPVPPGEEAVLNFTVNVANTAPASVDPSQVFSPTFTPSVTLPSDLLDSIQSFGIVGPVEVNNIVTTIGLTNASPAQIVSDPDSTVLNVPAPPAPVPDTVTVAPFGETVTAGPTDQTRINYSFEEVSLTVFVASGVPLLGSLTLNVTCNPAPGEDGIFAGTDILQPGPPIAPDVTTSVALGGTRTVTLPVSGNPAVDDVQVSVNGTLGSAVINKVGSQWRLTYVHDALAGPGTDVITYTATNAYNGGSSTDGTVTVEVLGNQCEANPSCSLEQIIEFDVEGTTLSMEQTGADVILDTVTLDGTPQSTTGELNAVTVIDARGDGAGWDLVGQVTDFKTDPAVGNCPRGDSSTWDYRCIPANNLGWSPAGIVAHEQIPGDVAAINVGSTSDAAAIAAGAAGSGLEVDQALCSADPTTNGGTFVCGAGLALLVPASASAGTYSATLTLTLS